MEIKLKRTCCKPGFDRSALDQVTDVPREELEAVVEKVEVIGAFRRRKRKAKCCCAVWFIVLIIALISAGVRDYHRRKRWNQLKNRSKTLNIDEFLPAKMDENDDREWRKIDKSNKELGNDLNKAHGNWDKIKKSFKKWKKNMKKVPEHEEIAKTQEEEKNVLVNDKAFKQRPMPPKPDPRPPHPNRSWKWIVGRLLKRMRWRQRIAFDFIMGRNKRDIPRNLFSTLDDISPKKENEFGGIFIKELEELKEVMNRWHHHHRHHNGHHGNRHHNGHHGNRHHRGRHLQGISGINKLTGLPHEYDAVVHNLLVKQRDLHWNKFNIMFKKERFVTFVTTLAFTRSHCHGGFLLFWILLPFLICCCKKKYTRKLSKRVQKILDLENKVHFRKRGYTWNINSKMTELNLKKIPSIEDGIEVTPIDVRPQVVHHVHNYPPLYTSANPFNSPDSSIDYGTGRLETEGEPMMSERRIEADINIHADKDGYM